MIADCASLCYRRSYNMSKVSETSNPFESVDTSMGSNPTEVHNALITTIKFDGMNYLARSQSALLYISGKDEYILKDMTIPSITNLKYQKLKTDNATVSLLCHGFFIP